ncbi:MAG TPA: phosphatidylinositol mannoside acyltransferase, partial [Actinomycetota bacterium]|nr:phosphatidylinositol mannoside acyltransferase [Actinomycetota bacterium]
MIQLVYYGYVAFSAVARWLPERFVYGVANLAGTIAVRFSKKRAVVAGNLARITGQPADSPAVQRLVREAYNSYARYWLETFRLVREDATFFLERFRARGDENLWSVVDSGRGAVVAVCHLGNWDAGGAWVGAKSHSLVTVAEVLKPRRMFEFFADHRARLGMTIFGAEPGVTKKLAAAAEGGAVVAILADRDLKGTGPLVEFFGAPAHLPAGAASIALETGCPLLAAGIYGTTFEDGTRGWEAHITEPIEVPAVRTEGTVAEVTQRIARRMEELIAHR